MRRRQSVTNDLILGGLAGAAAIYLMDRADTAMMEAEAPETRARTVAARPGGMDPAHVIAHRAADYIGVRLDDRQPHPAGQAIHYGIGVVMGALYAATANRLPLVGAGRGMAFGWMMSLGLDEGLNTYLGTAGRPSNYPWQDHARGVVAHGVWGLVVDSVLRVLNRR